MNGRKLLVTGAGGFCGLHACRHFAAAGYEVVGVLRSSGDDRAETLRRLGASPAACDLTDRREVERLMERERPDRVLHLAGLNAAGRSWQEPAAYLEANQMAAVYLLEAARKLALPAFRFVAAGSMLRVDWPADGGPPAPPHPYSLSKTLQTAVIRSWHTLFGMDAIVAEPANLIGPGPSAGLCALIANHLRAARRAAERGEPGPGPFRLSSATERRDFVDVRDAMAAYELLLERGDPARVYPIVSGRLRSLGEVAAAFDEALGEPAAWAIGTSDAPSPAPADGAAIRALGWAPAIPFETSIADLLADDAGGVEWFRRSPPARAANEAFGRISEGGDGG